MLLRWSGVCSCTPRCRLQRWWGCRTIDSASRQALHFMLRNLLSDAGDVVCDCVVRLYGPKEMQSVHGTQVAALVQVQSPGARPPQAWQTMLREFCRRQGLSGYKIPGVVRCQAVTLPANGSGKILKHEVRTIIQQQLVEDIPSKL